MVATKEEIDLLRLYVHDEPGVNQLFDDDQLSPIILAKGGDIQLAAAEVWKWKAARVSEWYLTNVDGAFLSRGEAFDHAMRMSELYSNSGSMTNVRLDTTPENVVQTPEF